MYVLAGYLPLKVFVIHRTIFETVEEANKFLADTKLGTFRFLTPMTLAQVTEHVAHNAGNVQLAPLKPLIPEVK